MEGYIQLTSIYPCITGEESGGFAEPVILLTTQDEQIGVLMVCDDQTYSMIGNIARMPGDQVVGDLDHFPFSFFSFMSKLQGHTEDLKCVITNVDDDGLYHGAVIFTTDHEVVIELHPCSLVILAFYVGIPLLMAEDVFLKCAQELPQISEEEKLEYKLSILQSDLQEAIEACNYERAALLRDEIANTKNLLPGKQKKKNSEK